jgi:hypothetical protein
MRVTAEVDRRSSQKAIGRSSFWLRLRAKARVDPWTLGAVHVERQAENDGDGLVFCHELDDALGVLGELGALDGLEGRRGIAHAIRYRDANGLGAEIEAENFSGRRDGV